MLKILVTGSNGLLGQKIVHALREDRQSDLIATSLGPNRISSTDGYKYHEMDITDRDQVMKTIDQFKPDAVINTAAMTNVDACEADRETCWERNVTAVEYLIEACEKTGSHLIHLSTDFVFDGEAGPYAETDDPNPLSYYGKSKWESEKRVMNSGLNKWSIARTIILYGVCEKMSRSNIVLWAKEALAKGDQLNIVDDQFRAPTFAEDLAAGCITIAKRGATGVYHLSGPETMSILELVKRIARFYDYDTSVITPISSSTLNQKAKRPPKTGFVLDKAIADLDYSPRTLEESLPILDEELAAL